MIRRAVAVLLVLGMPALGACGGAPSKEDYLKKADPVCKRGNELAAVATTPGDLNGVKDFATKLADNVDKTVKELEELDTPGGKDGEAAKAVVKSMKDAGAALRAVPPEVDAAHYTNIEDKAKAATDALKNADASARAFGSTECGKGEAEASGRMQTALGPTVKAAYIAKIDPMCAALDKEIEAIPEPQSDAQLKAYFDKLLAAAEKAIKTEREVPPPRTDKDKLDAFFTTQDSLVGKLREAQNVLSDEAALEQRGEEVGRLSVEVAAKAGAYGFKECSKTD